MKNRGYTPLPPDRDPKFLGLFTRDPRFYRTFFPLLFIIALQQLAALAVNLVEAGIPNWPCPAPLWSTSSSLPSSR